VGGEGDPAEPRTRATVASNRNASSVPDFDLSQEPPFEDRPARRWPDGPGSASGEMLSVDGASAEGGSGEGGGQDSGLGVGFDGVAGGGAAATAGILNGTTPARLSARPPGTGLALLQILACSGYPTQLLTMVVLALFGFQHAATPDEWSLGYVGTLLVIDSVLVIGLVVIFLRLQGERPLDVFLGIHPVLGEVARGLLLVPVVFALVGMVAFFVQRYVPWLHQEVNPFQTLIRAPNGILVVGALSVIVGGLREEIQRAFVLHRFTQIGTPIVGLIIFSLLFGLGHVVQGWDAVIMTTLLGATWGIVYLRRRSLVAPAVCHGAFDVIQVAALGLLT
jgi:membrane protease YdiL (CAAX protease family)